MASIKVKIRNRVITFDAGTTKAAIARTLFEDPASYSTNEVSKAVPMAYSQAMTIKKKMGSTPQATESVAKASSSWGPLAKAPTRKSMKPVKSPVLDAIKKGKPIDIQRIGVSSKVGKLRTPGLPSDTDVGECANCGFDLVIRMDRQTGQMFFVHVNMSQEDYLNVVQFCYGVPKILIA